jgi:hypothetical protein
MSGNRILYRPEHVARLRGVLNSAREDLREMHAKHLAELADLRAELGELREILAIVVGVARQQAETDVATLRRQLEYALARLERPAGPLH